MEQDRDRAGVRQDAGDVRRRGERPDADRPVRGLLERALEAREVDAPVGVLADRDDIGDRLAPRQLVAVVLVRPDEHERTLVERDVRAQRVSVVEVVGDAQVEDVDELVDRGGHPRPAEDDGVLVGATDGVADDAPRLLAEAAGLEPGPGRLRVRVRVERQHRVAQVVLDEGQRAAGCRVVRVRHAPDAERPGDRLVVADDRRADELDEIGRVRSPRHRSRSRGRRAGDRAGDHRPGTLTAMRIATWNVNSLKARQEAVERWLERAAPDILLMQETKLTDDDAPVMAFAMAGYQLVHHGEGRWNGVAIAARNGLTVGDVVTNFGDGPVRDSGPGAAAGDDAAEDFDPFDEARMVAATVDGLRVVSLYAPNGRVVDSPFYTGKLAWFERLARWIGDELASGAGGTDGALVLGGDLNVAPTDQDVWDAERGPRRHACLRAGAGRVPGPARPRPHRRLPRPPRRAGPLHVVGLPRRHVPQELRDADRPPAGLAAGRGAGRRCRDRPGGAEGTAGPIGSCAAVDGPRRAWAPVRSRLGRRACADRLADPLILRRRGPRRLGDRVARDPADDAVGRPDLEEPLVRVDELDLVATVQSTEFA